jgi:hypothetical protein
MPRPKRRVLFTCGSINQIMHRPLPPRAHEGEALVA